MDIEMEQFNKYIAPAIELYSVAVEAGFQNSPEDPIVKEPVEW